MEYNTKTLLNLIPKAERSHIINYDGQIRHLQHGQYNPYYRNYHNTNKTNTKPIHYKKNLNNQNHNRYKHTRSIHTENKYQQRPHGRHIQHRDQHHGPLAVQTLFNRNKQQSNQRMSRTLDHQELLPTTSTQSTQNQDKNNKNRIIMLMCNIICTFITGH